VLFGLMIAAAATACSEKPQTVTASSKKSDGKAWDAARNAYVVDGWKSGDQAGWEQQMRLRAQGQNEYSRVAAQK
jgi:predicted secreted protein